MIRGYRDLYYNVENMERAVQFYRGLGLTLLEGHEYFATLTLGDLRLGLHWTEGGPVPSTPRNAHGQHCGGTLTLLSDDVSADRKKIESLGGKILGESVQAWGHMLAFEDLDGNVMKLMNPDARKV